jgi:hypothetical protein
VAALIAQATGITPDLVVGKRSEFTIWVGDTLVAEKSRKGFPSDDAVISAVRAAIGTRK